MGNLIATDESEQWKDTLMVSCASGDLAAVDQTIRELFVAAEDESHVAEALDQSPSHPFLHTACKGHIKGIGKGNHTGVVSSLLSAKCNVNVLHSAEEHHGPPIFAAVEHGQEALVCQLLNARANVNATIPAGPEQGWTPIVLPMMKGMKGKGKCKGKDGGKAPYPYSRILKVLLDARADINVEINHKGKGKGLLHVISDKGKGKGASGERDDDIVQELLRQVVDAGLDVTAKHDMDVPGIDAFVSCQGEKFRDALRGSASPHPAVRPESGSVESHR